MLEVHNAFVAIDITFIFNYNYTVLHHLGGGGSSMPRTSMVEEIHFHHDQLCKQMS